MNTRFIYLLETMRKQQLKRNRSNKIVLTDELALQSRITKLADPTLLPP